MGQVNAEHARAQTGLCRPSRLPRDPHQDVTFVLIVFPPFLSDEEDLVKEEECPLVLSAMDPERALQDQLTVGGEIWSLPVDEQRLNLLCGQREIIRFR